MNKFFVVSSSVLGLCMLGYAAQALSLFATPLFDELAFLTIFIAHGVLSYCAAILVGDVMVQKVYQYGPGHERYSSRYRQYDVVSVRTAAPGMGLRQLILFAALLPNLLMAMLYLAR